MKEHKNLKTICGWCLNILGICLATLVMMPSQQNEDAKSLVAKQLVCLREHVTLKSLGVYSTSTETTPTVMPRPKSRGSKGTGTGEKSQMRRPRSQRISSDPTRPEPTDDASRTRPHPLHPVSALSEPTLTSLGHNSSPSSPTAALDARYFSLAESNALKLVAAADGREREGWAMVGKTKEVTVMKKPSGKDEPPVNSVKGVGLVNVPPRFIVRVLNDPSYTTVLDDMLKESRVVHELSKSLHLVQLLYKAIWPTSPREFSVLSILGELDERTWISSGISVEDPRISPEKGYVRAQLDVGGYLIRSVPSDPEVSEVTYVARVDLKGNIPAFAVNKISESQPLCVNRLRGLVESLYAKMKTDPQKMKEFEEAFPIAKVVPPKPAPPTSANPASASSTEGVEPSDDVVAGERSEVTGEVKKEVKGDSEHSDAAVSAVKGGASPSEPRRQASGGGEERSSDGSEAASASGGERAETRRNGLKNKEGEGERGKDDKESSTLVISMSEVQPMKSIRIPPNARLLPPNNDSLFTVGEEDGDSMADSWNGDFLETYTPEQLPSEPEEEEERGKTHRKKETAGSVFVTKPSPALQLKLPNYQRVRESLSTAEDPSAEVRGRKMCVCMW